MAFLLLEVIMSFYGQIAFSQEKNVPTFIELNRQIAQQNVQEAIQNPGTPVPGESIRALMEADTSDESCSVDKKKPSSPKKTESEDVEILMIVEGSSANQGQVTLNTREEWMTQYYQGTTKYNADLLKKSTTPIYGLIVNGEIEGIYNANVPGVTMVNHPMSAPSTLDVIALKAWVDEATVVESFPATGSLENPRSDHQTKYIEAIVQTIPKLGDISDKNLAAQISQAISGYASNEEEKYQLLSKLSDRLYLNYNDARNPGHNNAKNNPDGSPLPAGSLSLSHIFNAAAADNISQGGVCNDISEALAKVGEVLFPDKDVLTINAGTHFGVLIAGKDGSRVIDGSDQTKLSQQLNIGTDVATQNVRISKVVDDHLKEIAVMDTQLGDLVKSTIGSPVPQLKSGANFSKTITQATFQLSEKADKRRSMGIHAGVGRLLESDVVVVAAKYSKTGEKSASYVALGADGQSGRTEAFKQWGNQYHINLAAGFDRQLIRYVNPKVKLNFTTGLHANTSLGVNSNGVSIYGISGGVDLLNRATLQTTPSTSKAATFEGQVLLDQSVGPRNWGKTTGVLSSVSAGGIFKALGNMNFHLNQLNVTGSMVKPIAPRTSVIANANYLGSNVGQSLSLTSGIQVTYANGATILWFLGGETPKLKGYQTKHSLLAGPTGFKTGTTFQSKNKQLTSSVAVSNLAPKQKPQIDFTARYQINAKKKVKKTPVTGP